MATEVSVGSAAESTVSWRLRLRPGARRASPRSRQSVRDAVWIVLITAVVALGSIFLLFPVAFMGVTSLKTAGGAFLPPMPGFPVVQYAPQWQNYPEALTFMKWQTVFGNTVFIALAGCHGRRRRLGHARGLRLRPLPRSGQERPVRPRAGHPDDPPGGAAGAGVPRLLPHGHGQHLLAPDPAGLVRHIAFNIFLLRQFFTTIPIEMDEFARLDGAGPMRILWDILLPQIRPALAVVMIGSFTFNWNVSSSAPTSTSTPRRCAIPPALALASFQSVYGGTPYHLLMAASLVTMVPLLLLFFLLQRYFIQGIVVSGVKG